MIGKICCSFGNTQQIKKSFLHDLCDHIKQDIIACKFSDIINFNDESYISIDEFVNKVKNSFQNFNGKLLGHIEDRIDTFST